MIEKAPCMAVIPVMLGSQLVVSLICNEGLLVG